MPSHEALRALPSVDKVLTAAECAPLLEQHGHLRCTEVIREILSEARNLVANGSQNEAPGVRDVVADARLRLTAADQRSLRKVINLTGTVLHTNLGRAHLPASALRAVFEIAEGSSNLEFDIDAGVRGDRDSHVSDLIAELTGAEAATIVNNNAAAVLLSLNTLAQNREVCISRGELVEIGGSFRIPEVMEKSGCRLIEVGATNRTHIRDYQSAITDDTALLLKVHTSNYEIQGFTSEVGYTDIARVAADHGVPFMADLGSGTLVDLEQYGLNHEPTVQEVLAQGVDVVTFSGDKLLGGPQAGIIAGKAEFISKIKSNPLKRALRVDKMTMAALVEVLKLYREPESLASNHPTIRYLSRSAGEIHTIAEQVLQPCQECLADAASVSIVATNSQIGSGALPVDQLASFALEISPSTPGEAALQNIVSAFKQLRTPIIGRLQDSKLLFDLRTLANPTDLTEQLAEIHLP